MKQKIYYHHTDCGGIVYYANYLKFMEEARTEFFAQKGISINKLFRQGVLFVVARQEIDYKLPAFYGDILEVGAKIGEVGRARIEFLSEVRNQENKIVSKARTILVCVGKDLKPRAIPEDIIKKISQ